MDRLGFKRMLVVAMFALCGAIFAAESYLDTLDRVENWINQRYRSGSVAHRRAGKTLADIDNSQDPEEMKIQKLREKFPDAFKRAEEPLIVVKPLSWKIHSLSLGYDVTDSATKTSKYVNVISEAKRETEKNTETKKDETNSTHKVDVGASLDLGVGGAWKKSWNPLQWKAEIEASGKLKISGSYAYGRTSRELSSKLWNRERQESFSRERTRLEEMVSQQGISNLHLSFALTVTNMTNETVSCQLEKARIPVFMGNFLCGMAKVDKPYLLELGAGQSTPIMFRLDLKTTQARELVEFMGSASPTIEIKNSGDLPILNNNMINITDKTLKHIDTCPLELKSSGLYFRWDIREISDSRPVTLGEALKEVSRDIKKAVKRDFKDKPEVLKRDIFIWRNDKLNSIFGTPLDGFAAEDVDERFIVIGQSGETVYPKLTEAVLKERLSGGFTVWVIDLNDLKNYQDAPSPVKKAIFEQIKALAEADNGKVAHKKRLAMCYSTGFGVGKNPSEAIQWRKKAAEQYRKAAEAGDAEAQYNLADCYFRGYTMESPSEGVKWMQKAAEQGHVVAQTSLGFYYNYGFLVEKDLAKAEEWYRKAANQNYAPAQRLLGMCCEWKKDYAEAASWYEKAAAQGDKKAQTLLGDCYYIGRGVKKDYKKAFDLYHKAAKQGDKFAQYWLAVCYRFGRGVDKNIDQAMYWYHKSAEQKYAEAQFALGLLYFYGQDVPRSYENAVEWWTKAAEKGLSKAQYNLGVCYELGRGIKKDYIKAANWYRQAAEQGYAQAQNNLASCYADGNGVEQDWEKAAYWYHRAAEQGHTMAQYNLGVCYYNGEGVEEDLVEAVTWYRKAAEQGYARAQYNLGFCYNYGYGVGKDLEEAVKWYRKAAEQGLKEAEEALKRLKR